MPRRFWIVLSGGSLAIALAALLLGGTALADSESTLSPSALSQRFIDKLAQNLGITSDELQSKIKQSGDEVVDDAVANGEMTQEQGDALKQHIDSSDGFFGFGDFHRGPHGRMGFGFNLDTIATTLGMTTDELQTELQSGTPLSDIITAHGKTVDDVVTALTAEIKTRLDEKVAAGDMTQADADQKLANITQHLTDMINNGDMLGPGLHRFRGPGPNFLWPSHDDSDSNPDSSSATPGV